jgi:hypothetical protein
MHCAIGWPQSNALEFGVRLPVHPFMNMFVCDQYNGFIMKIIDVDSCGEHGCSHVGNMDVVMWVTWMYIHVGNMDVHSCREYGCILMWGKWMYIYVGNMDVH